MFANRRFLISSAAALIVAAGAVAVPSMLAAAAETETAPTLFYDISASVAPIEDAAGAATPLDPPLIQPAAIEQAAIEQAAIRQAAAVDQAALDCMAKIVHHESRGQPRTGQLAVAQTLINRLKAGRFGGSICAVANQRGQFFATAAYSPRRDTADWQTAVAIARDALSGTSDPVAPGAMFFRASYSQPNSFFRTRPRVAAIGGHIFYR